MSIWFLFLCAGFCISIVFYNLHLKVKRRAASFRLYAVRDALILLVAKGKLSEESKVYQYYYERINKTLSYAPNVGLDDALQSFINVKKANNHELLLENIERNFKEMRHLVDAEGVEIRNVVSDYYTAQKGMILAHSDWVKLCYLLMVNVFASRVASKVKVACTKCMNSYLLPSLRKIKRTQTLLLSLRVVELAEDEAKHYRSFIQAPIK